MIPKINEQDLFDMIENLTFEIDSNLVNQVLEGNPRRYEIIAWLESHSCNDTMNFIQNFDYLLADLKKQKSAAVN